MIVNRERCMLIDGRQRTWKTEKMIMGKGVCVLLLHIFSCCICCAAENDFVLTQLQRKLQEHCTDCHSEDVQEGEVRLDNLSALSSDRKTELLAQIEEQVYLERMPPEDEPQLNGVERDRTLAVLTSNFEVMGRTSGFREKLKTPSYGNYLSHEKLFSGKVTAKSFSPRRLWRTSPHVFENVKSQYGGDSRSLRQPFIVDDKQGIKDYASLLFADSAVVNVLLTNAGESADRLIGTPTVFKAIAESEQRPTEMVLQDAIEQQFRRVVYRQPTDAELKQYVGLFRESAVDAGNLEALRVALMAIMLHHESVYRVELGLGEADREGRRMLAPVELAFAIAYAITDQRPDQELLQAAGGGRLVARDHVEIQVTRILKDHAIDKPRLLRFFQEFFGYSHAHKIFKDAKRSGGFSYYGENYPDMYEREADFFILNILEDDTDVFRKLLTSDEYYILNRQTFRNTVYDFYLKNQAALDQGDFPEEKQQELLRRLDLRDWGELNKKYHLHKFNRGFNGSVGAIKQIVKEIKEWKNTTNKELLLHSMQPLYRKYPMVYDMADDEQDFLLPQPYKRPNRAGILTHPAWLIAHSLNDSTDPIRRGKWIRERLLAGSVPDLPITVDATIPENHNKTLRERLAVTEQAECWRCHKQMNPLGYAFEIYDDFGRFRTRESLDKLPKVSGQFPSKPIHANVMIENTGDELLDSEYDDALELIEKLADSDRVRQSIIRHVFRYFMGRNELLSDSQTLIAADKAYLESGGSFNSLLISLLTSDSFLYRK
ncbi:MAG: hypothetical protein CBD74_07185 [Saprospirales bacterium TMED214]|nr:MAG: hypothetical protein CBD74_07185 [Saprospirales bacterium TMED214]